MGFTLQQLLETHYGLKTSYNLNPLVTEVGVAAVKILSYNPNRLGLLIMNTSANSISISPKANVTTGTGIILVPAGGAISFKWDTDFELVASEFFGIAGGANSALTTIEIVSL